MRWLSSTRNKVLLCAPALIFYSVFYIFSLGFALFYSVTNFSGLGKAKFVGLINYLNLFKDNLFFISLKNTFIILIISFIVLLPLAFYLGLYSGYGVQKRTFFLESNDIHAICHCSDCSWYNLVVYPRPGDRLDIRNS